MPQAHLARLFNHCLRLPHFPNAWKEAKIITLPKPGKYPKFPQKLRPISLLPTTGKLFEKVILKFVQKHIEKRGLLNEKPVWFPCTSQHDTTMYEANGPRDPKFQQLNVYGCSVLGY
jgi:hypothetical protein